MVVHRTVLELHSQTELQRSAEQLKQLRLDLNIRSLCAAEETSFTPSLKHEIFTVAAELNVNKLNSTATVKMK